MKGCPSAWQFTSTWARGSYVLWNCYAANCDAGTPAPEQENTCAYQRHTTAGSLEIRTIASKNAACCSSKLRTFIKNIPSHRLPSQFCVLGSASLLYLKLLFSSGFGNGLELSESRQKHHLHPSKPNKEQTRYFLSGTINFHLMLVATPNLVELVRSCRRLGGVSDTPVEGPISFNGRRERRFLVEQNVDVCFQLCRYRLVHVNFA